MMIFKIDLCFNECLIDGKVTEEIFSQRFFEVRANELYTYYGVQPEDYYHKTKAELSKLLEEYKHSTLWFDEDMFCQINMLTLLAYLEQRGYGDVYR